MIGRPRWSKNTPLDSGVSGCCAMPLRRSGLFRPGDAPALGTDELAADGATGTRGFGGLALIELAARAIAPGGVGGKLFGVDFVRVVLIAK